MIVVQSAYSKYHLYNYIYLSHPHSTTSKFVIVNRNGREEVHVSVFICLQRMMEQCKIAMYMAIYMKEGVCLCRGEYFL